MSTRYRILHGVCFALRLRRILRNGDCYLWVISIYYGCLRILHHVVFCPLVNVPGGCRSDQWLLHGSSDLVHNFAPPSLLLLQWCCQSDRLSPPPGEFSAGSALPFSIHFILMKVSLPVQQTLIWSASATFRKIVRTFPPSDIRSFVFLVVQNTAPRQSIPVA